MSTQFTPSLAVGSGHALRGIFRFFSLPLRRAVFLPDKGADVEITEPYPLLSIARKKEDSSFPLGMTIG
jgi:hypothetical protein